MLRDQTRHGRGPRAVIALVVGLSMFMMASRIGAEEMGREKIDITEQGPNGQHMIFWRIQEGKFDEVGAFLDAGVDVNIRGFREKTPAIWAAGTVSWDMVLFLAQRGADLSARDRDGMSVCTIQEGLPTRLDTENGRALQEVRRILQERGICEREGMTS